MNRIRWLAIFMSVALSVFGVRLYDLQVTRHAQFAVQSDNNYQRDAVIRALRGEIRTQDGLLLATNRLAVDLIYSGGPVNSFDKIRYLADIQPEMLKDGLPMAPDYSKEKEVVLARNIKPENLPALYEFTALQPNLELRERVERVYPQGRLAAHLLGYTREADQSEVQAGYTLGDLVGASGLEYSLQKTLEGRNGILRSEVTAAGRPQSDRVVDPGKKGSDLMLTIDSTLQKAAEKAIQEALPDINAGRAKYHAPPEPLVRGAIIALDPRSGEVLAMASSPTFDPNWFSRTPSPDRAAKARALLSSSLDAVMQNRVVQPYDPGSVFKPSTSFAFVEKWGNRSVQCNPTYHFGGATWKNWAHVSLGTVDARLAIAFSCNPWFYDSAAQNPVEYSNVVSRRIEQLGFGSPTGLELVGEKSGNIPSEQQFAARNERWYPGFSINMSIGQGDVQVTPAQLALVLNTIINDGQKRELTVLKSEGGKAMPRKPVQDVSGGSAATFELVKEGMGLTTNDTTRFATAKHILGPNFFPVRTGGKTGTAENALSRRYSYSYTNAFYEGYGPLGSPTFEVVAFFQNGGEGSGPALNAAAKMFAARWCLKLDERHHALPGQTPCLGELAQMHAAYRKEAQAGQTQPGQSGEVQAQPGQPTPAATPAAAPGQ
ncbi:peptidoglycan D,D-transpeptidase FtsI family protein [Deinococcus sp.]|uniref:peptidoglycan D,D-transpeptidase FtsI family protein n=1 Tax=Deinococcus sp. TaxID=47478 RepID=UPI003C7E01EF